VNVKHALPVPVVGLVLLWAAGAPGARAQEKPKVQIPDPGVPEVMTIEGNFVRAAYNNEGYVILGYQVANRSLGEEWMLLEVGMTVRDGVPNYALKRDAISLETPDGATIPMATITEQRAGGTQGIENRAKVQRDSINYFPPSASQACGLVFFPDMNSRALARDENELSSRRGCVGRLFFQIPGGIKYGQHWLNVRFAQSVVRVPFRILTAEEEKTLSRNYGDIRKQVQDAFRKKD
jgi:hypothetical protein